MRLDYALRAVLLLLINALEEDERLASHAAWGEWRTCVALGG